MHPKEQPVANRRQVLEAGFSVLTVLSMPSVFIAKLEAGNKTGRKQSLAIGDKAPEFEVIRLSSQSDAPPTFSLSDFKGDLLFIDFWGTWCLPCREQNKKLATIYEENKSQRFPEEVGAKFSILSVACEYESRNESIALVREALIADKVPWRKHGLVLMNSSDDKIGKATLRDFYVNEWPLGFLIDSQGTILSLDPNADQLKKILRNLRKN